MPPIIYLDRLPPVQDTEYLENISQTHLRTGMHVFQRILQECAQIVSAELRGSSAIHPKTSQEESNPSSYHTKLTRHVRQTPRRDTSSGCSEDKEQPCADPPYTASALQNTELILSTTNHIIPDKSPNYPVVFVAILVQYWSNLEVFLE